MQTKVKDKVAVRKERRKERKKKKERGGFNLNRPQKENIDLSSRLDVGGEQATCRLWKQSGPLGGRGGRAVRATGGGMGGM